MKALFLDIDGVLNSGEWFRYLDSFTWAPRLSNSLLEQKKLILLQNAVFQTGANIILMSSWRISPFQMTRLAQQLNLYKMFIWDVTPSDTSTNRAGEVQQWLAAHPEVTSYVLVDDDDDGFSVDDDLCKHFVHTTWEYGLTEEKAEEIIEKMSL